MALQISTGTFLPPGMKKIGFVFGSCCLSQSFMHDLTAVARNRTVGGEIRTWTKMLIDGLELAKGRMIKMAEKAGADGIYGMHVAAPEVAGSAAEYVVYGTAYRSFLRTENTVHDGNSPVGKDDMPISTGLIPAAGVRELGLVYGACCKSRSIVNDMSELIRNSTVGGDLTAYSEMISEGVVSAKERMISMARKIGADCIYGVQIATPEIAGAAAELVMFGTACRTYQEQNAPSAL
jgi:uncharacterized protein YbjQ (UPF0145 family)